MFKNILKIIISAIIVYPILVVMTHLEQSWDGKSTYIQLDEIVLQKKLPVAFNEKNEIVNYSVRKNVIIIPRLINKVTLRLGNEKVTVIKKKTVIENKTEVADE